MGLRFGAYHFGRPSGTGPATITASAIAQADHFVSVAQPQAGELPPVLDLEATGGLSAQRARAVDAGVARRGEGAHGRERLRLRVAELLEGDARQHVRVRARRVPAVDRALDEERRAERAGQQLGRARLDVLAVDGLRERARLRSLRRRRPVRRPDPAPIAIPAVPDRRARARACRRRSSAPSRSACCSRPSRARWSGGKPIAFTYQWQQLRRRRQRLHADLRRDLRDVHADDRRRRARAHRHRHGAERRRRRRAASRADGRGRARRQRRGRRARRRRRRRRIAGTTVAGQPLVSLGRHVDGLADVVRLPVAALRPRPGVTCAAIAGATAFDVRALARRHRRDAVARRHRDERGRLAGGDDAGHAARRRGAGTDRGPRLARGSARTGRARSSTTDGRAR